MLRILCFQNPSPGSAERFFWGRSTCSEHPASKTWVQGSTPGFCLFQDRHVYLTGVPDRAARRLFSSGTLHPGSKEYCTISQKILSAHAARYSVFWMAQMLSSLMEQHPGDEFYSTPALQNLALYESWRERCKPRNTIVLTFKG